VTRIFEAFKKIFYSMVHSEKIHNIEVVGSYRRGKATCGDIDILICRPDGSIEAKLLQHLIR
jgi:DNA polymerase/3'-5' exonuclease PolX